MRSLPERGPFSLGRWSWSVNLASFLVRYVTFELAPSFPGLCLRLRHLLTVHGFHLRVVHPAHGAPDNSAEHELLDRRHWGSVRYSRSLLDVLGPVPLPWPGEDRG